MFVQNLSIYSQGIERKRNFGVNQGHDSGTNVQKMTCNSPNVDLVNMNADIKFGEILPFGSQDIERKQIFGANQ